MNGFVFQFKGYLDAVPEMMTERQVFHPPAQNIHKDMGMANSENMPAEAGHLPGVRYEIISGVLNG